jgi:hypothetical protein
MLKKTAEWLMEREIRFYGDWVHKNPAKVEASGWVFEFNNKWNPDVDDTAMVLLALRKIPTDNPAKRDECFQRGLKWMMTFQCKDGGWASFDKDCTKNILEKVPFADHNAMLDPECADITARILELLGYEGWSREHHQIQEALAFIREHQESDGSWYGRWGVNYIYGTWQVLRGMRAMNWNMTEPWLLKARFWLESVQRDDGGWGERCNTYDDPVFKGRGRAPRRKPRGPSWACARSTTRKSRAQTRHRIPDPHAKSRRLVERGRDDRHRLPEGVLFEIRHLPQRLAAAGIGDLQTNLPARRFNCPSSHWPDAFDHAPPRRCLLQPVVHYRFALRRPHRRWGPPALCVR